MSQWLTEMSSRVIICVVDSKIKSIASIVSLDFSSEHFICYVVTKFESSTDVTQSSHVALGLKAIYLVILTIIYYFLNL